MQTKGKEAVEIFVLDKKPLVVFTIAYKMYCAKESLPF